MTYYVYELPYTSYIPIVEWGRYVVEYWMAEQGMSFYQTPSPVCTSDTARSDESSVPLGETHY